MKAHAPVKYDKAILLAVRACLAGKASEGQQKACMDWIITSACGLYDMSYRDDADGGSRGTDFHEGRRFVGNSIVKMTRPETLAAVDKAAQPRTKRTREAKSDGDK